MYVQKQFCWLSVKSCLLCLMCVLSRVDGVIHSFLSSCTQSAEFCPSTSIIISAVLRGCIVTSPEVRLTGFWSGRLRDYSSNFAWRFDHCRPEAARFCRGLAADKEPAIVEERAVMQSVAIKCRGDIADGLVEALLCFGANSCSIEDAHLGEPREQEIYADGPVPWQAGQRHLWEQSHVTAIFPLEQDVGEAIAMASHSIGFNEMPQYKIDLVEDQEWIEQVQSLFEPLEVASGLWIVPRWRACPNPSAVNVILDPGLAFGTGEHPTTRLCLQWLSQVMRSGDRVLDYGIGSGILSIAALKMGAARAVGVDIDPMAISSATYNASLNMIEDHRLEVFLADIAGGDPVPAGAAHHPMLERDRDQDQDSNGGGGSGFEIVIANILANPLVELSHRITNYGRPGCRVGLSGVLLEQVDRVQRTYMEYLDNIEVTQDSGWACITGTKKLSQ